MYLKRDSLNLNSVKLPFISSKLSYQKYMKFQILMKLFLEIFAQKMKFINLLNYSMVILGTYQDLDFLKMSQDENTENVWDNCLEYKMISSIY